MNLKQNDKCGIDIQNKKVNIRTKQNIEQQNKTPSLASDGVLLYNFIMSDKTIKRVGILRGGAGKHYNSSLQKGGELILYIAENLGDKYKPVDILVDKDYIWHINGVPILPVDLIHKVDIVWNTSHPSFSNVLDSLSIPNIGVNSFSSGLENSRDSLREHIKNIGLPMPRQVASPKSAREVFEKFGSPWIVKYFTEDSNTEIHIVKTFPELANAISEGVKNRKSILVEEFIPGKIASLHTIPHFRESNIYTFPLGSTFGSFSNEEKDKLTSFAKTLHIHLGARHYLKSDFVLTPRGKVYLLQIDENPDLQSDSHFSEACESVGAQMHHVVEHILEQA